MVRKPPSSRRTAYTGSCAVRRLLDQAARRALVVKGAPDLVAERAGDRRREGVADLPVVRGLPAGELPLVLGAVPALDPGDHLRR